MPLTSNSKRLVLANTTGGVYKELDSSTVVNNIFTFADSNGVKTEYVMGGGSYVARMGGILPGSDRTAAANAVLASVSVKELVIDAGDITINGTLTVPTGKKLT